MEKKKREYYRTISIVDNDSAQYSFSGKNNAMFKQVRSIFKEAEEYRVVFSALTENRLRWSEVSSEDEDSIFDSFHNSTPNQLFSNLLMNDFYHAVPTGYRCLEEKVGRNAAAKVAKEAVAAKIAVKASDPDFKRYKIFYPTLYMIQDYENKLAKTVFRIAAKTGKLHESHIVRSLIEYDDLRHQYLPPQISTQVNFNLTDEFLKYSKFANRGMGSNNPYIKKKNGEQ